MHQMIHLKVTNKEKKKYKTRHDKILQNFNKVFVFFALHTCAYLPFRLLHLILHLKRLLRNENLKI